MKFSPDRKYILYAKNYNLFVKGNKAKGMDTTEVQLTFDGEKNFSYGNVLRAQQAYMGPGRPYISQHFNYGS